MVQTPDRPWTQTVTEVIEQLGVSVDDGLSESDAQQRLSQYGKNQLEQAEQRSAWSIFIEQFKSLIIAILAVAAILSFAFGQWIEGIAVLIAIAVNTVIGFFSEYRAVQSMQSLQKLSSPNVTVRRSNNIQQIPVEDLVPGDIVILDSGDVIGADLRVVEASRMQVNESSLTGESLPVGKSTDPLEGEVPLAERKNMLYKGTALTRGSGAGVVVATGMETELGNISALAEEAGMEQQTPLEKRLDKLGRQLVWITIAVAALVAVAGIIAGRELRLMVEIAIALSVAAVPEGLPIVATVALARGMWRMAKRNALINQLSAVETLGSTSVICTDKTGTLTENQMTVARLAIADSEIEITGEGLEPEGEFKQADQRVQPQEHQVLRDALEVGVLCNNAALQPEGSNESRVVGDPMEVALLIAGKKADMTRDALLEQLPEVREEAFDPDTKMMTTVHHVTSTADKSYRYAVKGAPEAVLNACTTLRTDTEPRKMTDDLRQEWRDRANQLASKGLRVLALAQKVIPQADADPYQDLTLLGVVGLLDPPRQNVRDAIQECQDAGIRVIMVTGDQAVTARNIGTAVGLVEGDHAQAMQGKDLQDTDRLSNEQRRSLIQTPIFARVNPEDKLNLIALHQENGSVVAMTGDGVNDAPALKKADIGIAMGQRGTEVAKEAADMVLQDDAFSTIVAAVEQGRAIFTNIRKFTIYLLSGNLGEIIAVGLASILNAPLPLLPLQILYINVVNDAFPALALGVGEGSPNLMQQPPRRRKESILTRSQWIRIVGYGAIIAGTILGSFVLARQWLGLEEEAATTISFISLGFTRLWHVFNVREPGSGIIRNEIVQNKYVWGALTFCTILLVIAVYVPGLSGALSTVDPGVNGWLLILGVSLVPLIIGQIVESLKR